METIALTGPLASRGRFVARVSRATACVLSVVTIGIQACGGGDSATEPAAPVTPSPTGSFTLSAAPVTMLQGGGGESKIAVVRTGGFTGSVALAVTGTPAGLTATISPSATSGTTATLALTTTASVAAGNVALTITGTATGRTDQTTTATVAIVPNTAGTGNVALDFSTCAAADKPIWLAVQDGGGSWRQVLGAADVYRFNVLSTKGGYAFVPQGSRQVFVTLASQVELTGQTGSRCDLQATKSVSGTLAGFGTSDVVYVGLGGGWTDPDGGPAAQSFTLSGVREGLQDFIAYRSNGSGLSANDRAIIRRDQNIANNGTVGMIDFTAAEAFAPATATLQVTGSGTVSHFMSYITGAGCMAASLYDQANSGTTFTMRGIPPAQQRANDLHYVSAYVTGPISYSVGESFHTMANRVIAFPAAIPAPAITAPPGGHKRLQASLTLPSEYQSSLQLTFFEQGGAYAWVTASFAWLGGSAATLSFPDLSGVTGWRSSFLPAPAASVGWFMAARGSNSAAAAGGCVENARSVVAYLYGTQ